MKFFYFFLNYNLPRQELLPGTLDPGYILGTITKGERGMENGDLLKGGDPRTSSRRLFSFG